MGDDSVRRLVDAMSEEDRKRFCEDAIRAASAGQERSGNRTVSNVVTLIFLLIVLFLAFFAPETAESLLKGFAGSP